MTSSQRRRLAAEARAIHRRFAAKNMHNDVPALHRGEREAFRGKTMRDLARPIESDGAPACADASIAARANARAGILRDGDRVA